MDVKYVSLKFHGCFQSNSKLLQGSFKKILKVFQRSFMLQVTHRSYPSRRRACFSSHELVLEEVMLLKNVYPWSLNICVKYVA